MLKLFVIFNDGFKSQSKQLNKIIILPDEVSLIIIESKQYCLLLNEKYYIFV